METLISLSEAFRRMLETEDRALGVDSPGDPQCFSGPTDARIANIMSRMPGVTVYGERRRSMPGKKGDITYFPGGGSVEIVETGGQIEKPYQSSEALRLSEISEGKAHLELIRLLQNGQLHAWGEMFEESMGFPDPVPYPRAMLPLEIWTEQRRIRKKANVNPAMPAPFPNYSASSMPPVLNKESGKTEEFRNIQVDADQLQAHLKMPVGPASVTGGVFRVVREAPSNGVKSVKELKCLVHIKCADCEAYLEPSLGLAAIGLLLGSPGEPMAWETLHTAAKLFQHGAAREGAIQLRNQVRDAVDWRPGNAANLGGASDWPDSEVALYDDSLSVTSGRSASFTTPDEIRSLERQLNSLKIRAEGYSGIRKVKTLEEIKEMERHISKLRNDQRRTSGPDDGHRQAIYHEMEAALTLLALRCPALAGHLGTLHKLERRAFQTEERGIMYNPGSEISWVTQPVQI